MRSRLYLLSSLLPACLGCLLPMQDSEAATRIVHARGAAAIVGNDIASARKAALAEALVARLPAKAGITFEVEG